MELVPRMSERQPPADMLLLLERQRRARSRSGDVVERPDALLAETDALVEDTTQDADQTASSLTLFRPLALVSLARISWSGAIDHVALQNEIVCCAPQTGSIKAPGWLAAVAAPLISFEPRGEPALRVTLTSDETTAIERTGTRFSAPVAIALARAAVLPATIVGADAAAAEPAKAMLAAYRRAALLVAWQDALGLAIAEDAARQRDAAAAQLMSMLRALLGEA